MGILANGSAGNSFVHSLLVTLGNHALSPSRRTIALVRPATSGIGVRPVGVLAGTGTGAVNQFLGAEVWV